MRIPSSFRDRSAVDIKMTPMIDVVFLLLIFFVCTASFQIVENVLPSQVAPLAGGTTEPADIDPELVDLERIVIQVKWLADQNQPAWTMNDQPYPNLEQLGDKLSKIRRDLSALKTDITQMPVILDVEGDVPVGYVIDAYDLGRIEGFRKIQMTAEEL